mmetsp:Transcript_7594/g.16405  ORF Transcript_7594/g.16405 Transcript_7594/m.16405 type:complete len:302 (+) Transcript_7594:153-1058(+)
MSSPIPAVANVFVTLYRALPKVSVPFTSLDISFSLLSAIFLTSVRFGSEYALIQFFGWPEDSTPTRVAASSCGSITHSTILCTGLIVAFWTQAYDVAAKIKDQAKPNQWWPDFADALLQFCTGYMIYDGFTNILWLRWDSEASTFMFDHDDFLFIAHHIVTSFYMISARVIGAGYMSAMACMLLGEITNPLQNLYLIGIQATKLDYCNGAWAQAAHVVTIVFAAAYFSVRVIIAPPFFLGITIVLLFTKRGRTNIPLALNVFWNMLIWGVCFGSGSWIRKCYYIVADFIAGESSIGSEGEL